MKFQRRKTSHLHVMRLPLVAFVDVVLFMLFFFIMAGSFGAEEARLASTLATDRRGGGTGGASLSSQVVRIEAEGARVIYRLGGRAISDRAELGRVLALLPKEPGVVVKAGDTVPVEAAAAALQLAHDAGFTKVSYAGTR